MVDHCKKALNDIQNLDQFDVKALPFVHNKDDLIENDKDMRDLVDMMTLLW